MALVEGRGIGAEVGVISLLRETETQVPGSFMDSGSDGVSVRSKQVLGTESEWETVSSSPRDKEHFPDWEGWCPD